MTDLIKTTAADVADTAESVIDDILAGLGALSPLGSLITALLSLCGVSTGNIASVLAFVTALNQFLSTWQDKLVTLIVSGFTSYEDLVRFCKGIWQLFTEESSEDTDTDADADSDGDTGDTDSDVSVALARIFAGKPRFAAVSLSAAEHCVSDMQGFARDVESWIAANPGAPCTEQRAAVQALAAKWKQSQAARLSQETADSIAAA